MIDEHKFLEQVSDLFFRLGLKSVTMDDIARHLGISKKTLYNQVSNKSELVSKIMMAHIEHDKCCIRDLRTESENAIDALLYITRHLKSNSANISPTVIFDLQKYYPATWQQFLDYKNSFLYDMILENIQRGLKEGLYRNNIHPPLIAKFYTSWLDRFAENLAHFHPEISFLELHREHMKYHIHGIASDKGIKYLKKAKLD